MTVGLCRMVDSEHLPRVGLENLWCARTIDVQPPADPTLMEASATFLQLGLATDNTSTPMVPGVVYTVVVQLETAGALTSPLAVGPHIVLGSGAPQPVGSVVLAPGYMPASPLVLALQDQGLAVATDIGHVLLQTTRSAVWHTHGVPGDVRLSVQWPGAFVDMATGIAGYQVCVETAPALSGPCNVIGWTALEAGATEWQVGRTVRCTCSNVPCYIQSASDVPCLQLCFLEVWVHYLVFRVSQCGDTNLSFFPCFSPTLPLVASL
jgi:hypothetical protein